MDWFKALNIGLNAVQATQLHQTKQHLQRMETSQQEQKLAQELLAIVKNLYFATSQSAEALEDKLTVEPQKVLVGARLLEWRLRDLGVTPEVFPTFDDKEYAAKTHKAIKSLIASSTNALTPEQAHDAEECFNYILEMPALNESIEAVSAYEKIKPLKQELESTEPDWLPLKNARNKRLAIGLVIALIGPGFVCMLGSLGMQLTANVLGPINYSAGFTLVQMGIQALVVGVLFIGGLIYALKSPPKEFKEINNQRNNLQKTISELAIRKSLHPNFKNMTSSELVSLRNSRQSFIQRIFDTVDEDYEQFILDG